MKKKQLIGIPFEIPQFPVTPDELIILYYWVPDCESPWRRIIGTLKSSDRCAWDVLTCDCSLKPRTILQTQNNRWQIEVSFQWLKQHTTIKTPLGTSWDAFITHCFLVMLLFLILLYFLFLLGIDHWVSFATCLLRDLRYSDAIPWSRSKFIQRWRQSAGGGN